MEDVTDIVFRKVVAKAAKPDVFFTEFTNTDGYVHAKGYEALRGRLMKDEDEKPIVAHIWGDKPENFEKMSIDLANMGFDGIDINMGCPAPGVINNGCGSGLILNPNLAGKIIEAAKLGGLPVSVKTRLGFNEVEEWKIWLSFLLKQDLVNLSIHLRTTKELSNYPAHWELIPDILKLRDEIAPNTLITINGDIKDYQMGMEFYDQYKVDGIMIGRGIFHNPFAFDKHVIPRTSEDYLDLFKYHLDTYDKYIAIEPTLQKKLQRFFKIYIRDIKGAAKLRLKLMDAENTIEIRNLIHEFLQGNLIEDAVE